jgi:hypothetical protein
MKFFWCSALGASLLAAAFGFAQVSSVRLETRLAGNGNDKGKAKWKAVDKPGDMQAELEVEGENLAPNTVYLVYVAKNVPWSVQTNGFGEFELEQRYIGPNRPSVPNGSLVVVKDQYGNAVLWGNLSPR